MKPNSERHSGIDCMRVLAIVFVLLAHTQFFTKQKDFPSESLALLTDQGGRWALPFFWIVAGYFWGKKIRAGNDIDRVSMGYGARIFKLWAFWSLVYLIVPNDFQAFQMVGISAFFKVPYWRLMGLLKDPIQIFFVGSKWHLWFFMSLLWGFAVTTVVLKYGRERWLIWFGAALYACGLILPGSLMGIPKGVAIPFQAKWGPFFSTIFIVIGWYFSKDEKWLSSKFALKLLLGGILLSGLEIYFFYIIFKVPLADHSFLLGTLLYGVGVTGLILSKPKFGENTFISQLGKYVLGIYAIHYIYIDLFKSLYSGVYSHLWDLALPLIVFLLSLLTAVILGQNRFLKRFIF
jgi:peptidoglycan/LPS O-acetylase OafA/YrhL